MSDADLKAAAADASAAAGVLNSMAVGVGRTLQRLRAARERLMAAGAAVDATIKEIEERSLKQ